MLLRAILGRNVQTHHHTGKTLLWLTCAVWCHSRRNQPERRRNASKQIGAKQDPARLVGKFFHLIHIDIRQSIADFHKCIPRWKGSVGGDVGGDDSPLAIPEKLESKLIMRHRQTKT